MARDGKLIFELQQMMWLGTAKLTMEVKRMMWLGTDNGSKADDMARY